ncbi:MAG: family 2 glycosyl transferase [Candidatus Atribacteria bacterium]|nr:family 2 glycosyl transferase [Candidatus Atribacteria bacterium]
MISVICVFNDRDVLEKYLLKSLNTQSVEFELILLDNVNGKFKSAPEALNYGGNKANGDNLMFIHQDVDLKSDTWLEDVEKEIEKLENCGIAGVAGVPENGVLKSNIENGIPPNKPGEEINTPIPVQTLDECLVIIPRSVFQEYQFDETLNGWHLYSVDYCLNIIKQGFNVYVMPAYIYHRSYMIYYSKDYYRLLKILFDKYRDDYEKIYTSCGAWNTSYPVKWYLFLNTRIGFFIKSLVDKLK